MPVGWLTALHVCAYGKSLRSKKFISAHMVEEKSTLHAGRAAPFPLFPHFPHFPLFLFAFCENFCKMTKICPLK